MAHSTISLCMITRDEEQFLGKCLDSVKGLVDEIVVVDTGSADGTKETAGGHGARVLEFEWTDDFSKARNYSIRNAVSEWILVLDADEVISSKDHEKLRLLTSKDEYDGYTLIQRNYTDVITDLWKPNNSDYPEGRDYPGYDEVPIIRLFRNREDICFHGNIHELIRHSDESVLKHKATEIPIHHYGKVRDHGEMKKKRWRYLEMNLRKVELDPNNPKAYFELGRQYFECEKYTEAIEAFEKSLKLDPNQSLSRFDLAVSYWKNGEPARAKRILKELVAQNPSANALTMLGIVYMEIDEPDKALGAFEKALENDPDYIPAYNNIGTVYSRIRQYDKSIPFFQTALKINPNYTQARGNLAVAYERTLDWENALNTYKQLLDMEPKSAPFIESRLRAIEGCL